jgi:hypothetical protein
MSLASLFEMDDLLTREVITVAGDAASPCVKLGCFTYFEPV